MRIFLLQAASLSQFQGIGATSLVSKKVYSGDFSFKSTMIEQDGVVLRQPGPDQTTSIYRRWIARLFGFTLGSSPRRKVSPVVVRWDESDWIIVHPITRSGSVFTDLWDPEASGDWTPSNPLAITQDVFHVVGPQDAFESDFTELDLADRSSGSLLKWAFKTDISEEAAERDLERMSLWREFVSENINTELPSYFESVVMEIPEHVATAINRDVLRTQPEELQPRMARVLMAYASRNPVVGFCQGMTYLVSGLLQQSWVTDELAFELLAVIAENVNKDYYDDDLSGLHTDLRRIEKFLFYIAHVKEFIKVPLMLVLVEPMMCVLTRLSPPDVSVRIFDIMFTHGKLGLLSLYIGIVDLVNPAVTRAIEASESADSATVDGIVAFKLALVDLLGRDPDLVIKRAEAVLISNRMHLERIIADSFAIEQQEAIEVVVAAGPPHERFRKHQQAGAAGNNEESISQEPDDGLFVAMDNFMVKAHSVLSRVMGSLVEDD